MIHTWEPIDISAGLYVIKNTSPKDSKDFSFACTVVFKIGFGNGLREKYGSISCLTDGWFNPIGSKEDVCDWLNSEGGYRPLSKSEYIKLIESTNQGFLFH